MDHAPLSPARAGFGQLLVHVARSWRRKADAALAACGLSEATAVPLLVLSHLGAGVRHGALAERLGIEGPSLVRLIDALEADGLVTRREDEGDRRAKTLHLTRKGKAQVEKAERILNRVRADLLRHVSEDDLQTTLRVLHAIEQAFQQDQSQAGDRT